MAKYRIDTVLRIRTRHRPGQLARLATVIAQEGALIGEITTIHMAEGISTRDLTIETEDEAHTERTIAALSNTDGVEVVEVKDRVFELHRGGKIASGSRVELRNLGDMRYIYTPGVARVSRAIAADSERAWDYTNIGRSVGIFTNGSRVLGLGNIGPLASMPVMEGKAVLYDKFAGLSATPILIDTLDADEFIETVVRASKGFGGVHLEDIRIPECFKIEAELKRRLHKPVMHDDQHGTAIVALAALLGAAKVLDRDMTSLRIVIAGAGAAGVACANILLAKGIRDVTVLDSKGIVHSGRSDLNEFKSELASRTNPAGRTGGVAEALHGADMFLGVSAGIVPEEIIATMAPGGIVFALSNPDPEIHPDVARKYAAVVATGRSDFPNQINNVLAFPGVFRGALDAGARRITEAMKVAAAEAIHAVVGDDLAPDYIVPSPLDPRVAPAVAAAVAAASDEAQG